MTEYVPDTQRRSPSTPSAADLLGPQDVLTVQEQGWAAGFAAQSPLSCPWASATEPADLARRDMWIRGYAAGKTDLRIATTPDTPPRQSPH